MNTELAAIVFKEDIHKKLEAVLGKCLIIDSAVFLVTQCKISEGESVVPQTERLYEMRLVLIQPIPPEIDSKYLMDENQKSTVHIILRREELLKKLGLKDDETNPSDNLPPHK